MGIGVPRHFDPGMSEAAGYFLDIDPGICQKGGVRVPEVVDADFFDPGHLGKLFVVQLDCGIPQGTGTAADLICFRKSGNCFPSCLVLVQNSQKGGAGICSVRIELLFFGAVSRSSPLSFWAILRLTDK